MFFKRKPPTPPPSPVEGKKYTIGGVPATLSQRSDGYTLSFPKPVGGNASLVAANYITIHCNYAVSSSATSDDFVLTIPLTHAAILDYSKPSPGYIGVEDACEKLAKFSTDGIARHADRIRKKSEERALAANLGDTGRQVAEMKKNAMPFVGATLDALAKQGVDVSSVDSAKLLSDVAAALVDEKMKRGRK